MEITMHIPDELIATLGADVGRRALELYALEEYREGKLTHAQLGRLLGFATPMQVDEFLKHEGIELEYTSEDLASDAATLAGIMKK